MKELPLLHQVYNKYKNRKDFAFITVATDSEEELLRFLNSQDTSDIYRKLFIYSNLDSFYLPTLACLRHGFSKYHSGYTIIQDSIELKRIGKMIKSRVIPTTLIYSPRGKLVFEQIGSFDNGQVLTYKIDSLLSVN
jgi:thiol-disulfide isomerase/thioredoxin